MVEYFILLGVTEGRYPSTILKLMIFPQRTAFLHFIYLLTLNIRNILLHPHRHFILQYRQGCHPVAYMEVIMVHTVSVLDLDHGLSRRDEAALLKLL